MSATPDNTLADPQQIIADLQRQLAECRAERDEALEQQTATAEVLDVINSSPGDLTPVFNAMLEKATRLCEAPFGILRTWDGERFQFGAVYGEPWFADLVRRRHPFQQHRDDSPLGRILKGERIVPVPNALSDEGYRTSPSFRDMVEASGVRSGIMVALQKEEALPGTITVYRREVRPFSDKQIALLEKAHTLCGAAHGNLWIYDGELFHPVATRGNPRFAEWLRDRSSVPPAPGTVLERIVRGEDFLQIADAASDQAFCTSAYSREVIEVTGARTTLIISLRKDTALLGIIFAIARKSAHSLKSRLPYSKASRRKQ